MKENFVFWYIVLKNRRCFRKQQKSLGDLELSFVHAWTVIKKTDGRKSWMFPQTSCWRKKASSPFCHIVRSSKAPSKSFFSSAYCYHESKSPTYKQTALAFFPASTVKVSNFHLSLAEDGKVKCRVIWFGSLATINFSHFYRQPCH